MGAKCYTNLATTTREQNYIGIKSGDVNNSWGMASVAKTSRQAASDETVSPALRLISSGAQGAVEVQVRGNALSDLTSAQFSLQWDPSVLRFVSVKDLALPGLSEANFGQQSVAAGKLSLSWEDPAALALPNDSTLFTVQFEAAGAPGSSCLVTLGDEPTEREVTLAGSPVAVRFGSTIVTIPPSRPALTWDSAEGCIRFSVPTTAGTRYVIETSPSLSHPAWVELSTVLGDGSTQTVVDGSPAQGARFYRVRVLD